MSFVDRFAPHIPFLRRYARALTGSQRSGDAYVRASLLAISETSETPDPDLPDRIALYRFCHIIWAGTGSKLEPHNDATVYDDRLQALGSRERQAFLLTAMEGFSRAEAALILNTDTDEIDALVGAALAEIESDLATTVLIIEDEPIIAADLGAIVEEIGHTVVASAATHREAVTRARTYPPGLILCDIQLADNSSGLEAAAEILRDFDIPVIVITAFPERLLTGERKEPTYLITKPFQPNAIKAAVAQALFFHARPQP